MPPGDRPAMPSPARLADRSITLAVRLGVEPGRAPQAIADCCQRVADRIIAEGGSDVAWLYAIRDRARQRAGQ